VKAGNARETKEKEKETRCTSTVSLKGRLVPSDKTRRSTYFNFLTLSLLSFCKNTGVSESTSKIIFSSDDIRWHCMLVDRSNLQLWLAMKLSKKLFASPKDVEDSIDIKVIASRSSRDLLLADEPSYFYSSHNSLPLE